MAAVAAYRLRRQAADPIGRRTLPLAVVVGFAASLLVAFPTGHEHARQVARTQPEKFAAIEGLYTSQQAAPLVLFGLVQNRPPKLEHTLEIPGLLSWMALGDANAVIRGIDEFPPDDIPPLWMTFVSFHNMVILGLIFIAIAGWGVLQLWRRRLFDDRRYLKLLVLAVPLPVLATQFGWVTAEVGRQPWIVYHLLRTADAHSATVGAGEILFSILLFGTIYAFLGVLWGWVVLREARHGLTTPGTGEVA
jgi:cytochrome d ubiquinol oxidase subunit I